MPGPELYSQFFSSSTITNIKDTTPPMLVNQDEVGCFTIQKTGRANQNEIWSNLFTKINRKLFEARYAGKNLQTSGSTFCAILYDPVTEIFSTANLGDSRAYCCLEEIAGEKRKFLISLTRDDDPNDPMVAAEYKRKGGHIVVDDRGRKYTTAPGAKGLLAMTASLGDDEIRPHIGTPLIFNFTIDEVAAAIRDRYQGEVALTKFFVASDGFCDVEKFFTQDRNPSAPFCQINILNISQEILDRAAPKVAKEFRKIAPDGLDYSKIARIFQEYERSHPQEEDLAPRLTTLARAIGSKDDITVGEVNLREFYKMLNRPPRKESAAQRHSEILLSFVCDGHGRNGHEVSQIIKQAVEEFVREQNAQCKIEDREVSENYNLYTSAMLQEAMNLDDEEDAYKPQPAARAASSQSLNPKNLQHHLT